MTHARMSKVENNLFKVLLTAVMKCHCPAFEYQTSKIYRLYLCYSVSISF